MSKLKNEFEQHLQECKTNLSVKVKDWSDDTLKEYLTKVEKYYSKTGRAANMLGNFSFNQGYVYHWHTLTDDAEKLPRRLDTGWSFATREEAERAGLSERRTQDSQIDGDTCVEMSHGNVRAVLLKIPRDVYELNLRVRERINQNRPLFDENGKPVRITVKADDGRNVVQHIDGGIASMEK